jgi:hypothetical protein
MSLLRLISPSSDASVAYLLATSAGVTEHLDRRASSAALKVVEGW